MADHRGGRIGMGVLLALFGSCCALGAVAVVLEDTVATSIARDRLHEAGVECDDRLAIDVTPMLDLAVIAPTTCTLAEGAIESFELLEPVSVELGSGFEARLVRGARVRVGARFDPPVVRASGWGAMLETLAIPERVGMLVQGAAELAARDLPQIELDAIEVAHEGEATATLSGVHVVGRSESTPMTLRVDRVDLPPLSGPIGARATMVIAPMSAVATPAHVELEGDLDVDATLPIVGSMRRRAHLGVVGSDLDTAAPRYDVRL